MSTVMIQVIIYRYLVPRESNELNSFILKALAAYILFHLAHCRRLVLARYWLVGALLPRVSRGWCTGKSEQHGADSEPHRAIHRERALWLSDRRVQVSPGGIVSHAECSGCGGCDHFRGVWTARPGPRPCCCRVLAWQQSGADLHQCDSGGEDHLQPIVSEPCSSSRVVLRGAPQGVV